MIKLFGITNLLLMSVLSSIYWIPLLNKHTLRLRTPSYQALIRFLRKVHKPLGLVLLATAFIHGALALGRLALHTGSLTWIFLFITSLLGGAHYRKRKPTLFIWHRRMALVAVLFMFLHLLAPEALSLF